MGRFLTEKMWKEMLERREYYSTHPEESLAAYLKRDDGYVPIGIPPEKTEHDEQKKLDAGK